MVVFHVLKPNGLVDPSMFCYGPKSKKEVVSFIQTLGWIKTRDDSDEHWHKPGTPLVGRIYTLRSLKQLMLLNHKG